MTAEEIKKEIDARAYAVWSFVYDELARRKAVLESEARAANEAPCAACGKTAYVVKYRDVRGSVSGAVSGRFSLFGGSVSGEVSGNTATHPVLSCRGCGNEKLVAVSEELRKGDVYEELIKNECRYLVDLGAEALREYEEIFSSARVVSRLTSKLLASFGLERKFPELPWPPDVAMAAREAAARKEETDREWYDRAVLLMVIGGPLAILVVGLIAKHLNLVQ
jgi:hypothetical protein